MSKVINNQLSIINRKGAALLVVLLIVMTVTILSLGFLSRSDAELACGRNMVLRTQMDYLAESGLEHAKGLILSPQEVDSEYWAGAVRQQLVPGSSDYYDVEVLKLGECNYQITCDAYRESNGEEIGRSNLKAELRLDPCITLWTATGMTIWQRITIDGDVCCSGTLANEGVINGDVFANGLSGNAPTGQTKAVADLSLEWPQVTAADFTSHYSVQPIAGSLAGVTFGPYDPVRVCYYNGGNVQLAGNVQIYGMLLVEGDLIIRGDGNVITAGKNLPALLVTGNLIIESGSGLNVAGLPIVEGEVQVSAGAADVGIVGGLFAKDGIVETTADSSGNGNAGTLYNCPTWQPSGGQIDGAIEFDGVNDYVAVANSSSLQLTSALTIAAWIKGDAWGTGSDVDTIARKGEVTPVNYQLAIADKHVSLMLDNTDAGGGFRGNTLLNTGQWYHVAATWDGSTVKIYVDGVLDKDPPASRSGTIGTDTRPLYIGGRAGADLFDGIIDDVRIYDRALDANDILIASEVGLVGHWKLDEQGSNNISVTCAPLKAAIVVWPGGVAENWSPAEGAFFRSIARQ